MGGLCVGSAVLPRLLSARWNPLRVYACLELGVGAFGIAILFGLPFIGRVFAGATPGMAALVARGAVSAVCLVPPTLLMGASFPAIARWVEATSKPIAWMGALYSANVAGAVVGCVIAGFYLLRVLRYGDCHVRRSFVKRGGGASCLHRLSLWERPARQSAGCRAG